MRVAIIHYWLVNWRGGERVLRALLDAFPQADLYVHVFDPEVVAAELPRRKIRTTFIARLPFARRWYQRYLPLMPLALEQLDLRQYDMVISSESGPAKGVVVPPGVLHVCYCHSPMRYVWDLYHDYRGEAGPLTRAFMSPVMHYMRLWDQVSAQRVDHYIANSSFVAQRIEKYYRRPAEVIYPPVRVGEFDATRSAEDFYLYVGQLVPYKRVDLVVEAFNTLGYPVIIVGGGAMLAPLRRRARPNVKLVGSRPFQSIRELYARCRALVFPGVEDFGMVPVEAMASGKPVIALARGGALETVIDGETGLFFHEQTAQALSDAVRHFESMREQFDRDAIRAQAAKFSEETFRQRFSEVFSRLTGSAVAWP